LLPRSRIGSSEVNQDASPSPLVWANASVFKSLSIPVHELPSRGTLFARTCGERMRRSIASARVRELFTKLAPAPPQPFRHATCACFARKIAAESPLPRWGEGEPWTTLSPNAPLPPCGGARALQRAEGGEQRIRKSLLPPSLSLPHEGEGRASGQAEFKAPARGLITDHW
jgi:hypothetical protein